jgi:tRNA (adenine37-N6)-methyltransferase
MSGTNNLPEDSLLVHPVEIVQSPVQSRREMPMQGVSGVIEIFPAFAEALDGIGEKNSHLFVLCWMYKADKTVRRTIPRRICSDLPAKGVFSLRSPARPNPVSLCVVGLVRVKEGRFLVSHTST